jgi:hypothetical protein
VGPKARIRERRWQSGPAMISSHVRRRPPSNTDADNNNDDPRRQHAFERRGLCVQIPGPAPGRHAVRLGIFLPFRDPWHDVLHHLGRLPGKRLRRLSVAAKPAAGMLIRGRALSPGCLKSVGGNTCTNSSKYPAVCAGFDRRPRTQWDGAGAAVIHACVQRFSAS